MRVEWLRFLLISFMILTFISSCSYSPNASEEDESSLLITLEFPENHLEDVSVTPRFSWHTDGGELDRVVYNLYLSKNKEDVEREASDALIAKGIRENHFENGTPLDFSTKYFWKVVAYKDDVKAESDVWDFTTVSSSSGTPKLSLSEVATIMVGESNTYDVSYASDLLYVGTDKGIYIMNGKSVIKRFSTDALIEQIEVAGNSLYVILNRYGINYLITLDISDPLNPHPLNVISIDDLEPFFRVDDYRIFLKDSDKVKIYEYDPKSSELSLKASLNEDVRDIAVLSDVMYIATGDSVKVFDISDLENPIKVNEITRPYCDIEKIAVHSNKLFIKTSSELIVMDISDPKDPALLGKASDLNMSTNSMIALDNRLYMAGPSWIDVFDLSDITSPRLVKSKHVIYISRLRSINGNLYVTGLNNGVTILNKDLEELDRVFPYANVRTAILDHNTLYAYSSSKLNTVDLTPDLSASKVCEFFLPDYMYYINKLLLHGTVLYLGDFYSPLAAVDVSKKCQPNLLFQSNIEGRFDVENGYVYVISSDGDLYIAKLNGDSTPIVVGHTNISFGQVTDITAASETVYLSTLKGILIVDVSDPSSPQVVHKEEIYGIWRIQKRDDYIYATASDGDIKLIVFKLLSNHTLLKVNELDVKTLSDFVDMESEKGYIFILERNSLHIIDLSNPENPVEVLQYNDIPQLSNDLSLDGDMIIISGWENGIHILRIEKR